jgi:hypothetical protein
MSRNCHKTIGGIRLYQGINDEEAFIFDYEAQAHGFMNDVSNTETGVIDVQNFAWSRVFGFYRKHLYGIDRFLEYTTN